MTIDRIDALVDLFDIFENWDNCNKSFIWNGREITMIDQKREEQLTAKARAIIESLNEEKLQILTRYIEQLDSLDERDVEWRYASASQEHQFILADSRQPQYEIIQCGLFKKGWDAVRKSAKKAAKVFKKIIDAVRKATENFAHGTRACRQLLMV